MKRFLILLPLIALFGIAGCAARDPHNLPPIVAQEVLDLEATLRGLGASIDPAEAKRAARIAYEYPRLLAVEYGVTDSPLVHNAKVNAGRRPRGLCWHWAEDMEKRLAAENFKTLDLHRAIANSDVAFRIDHSTVIISKKGDSMYEGVILDPWRFGGTLFWSKTPEDKKYKWLPQQQVLQKRARERAKG